MPFAAGTTGAARGAAGVLQRTPHRAREDGPGIRKSCGSAAKFSGALAFPGVLPLG